MKVRCTFRRGDPIPAELLAIGYTPMARFSVVEGRTYLVFSVLFSNGLVHYLLTTDETLLPDWVPSLLFEIVDPRPPSGWEFQHLNNSAIPPNSVICGYPEIAKKDGTHFVDLEEREEPALQIFERRRAEIEADPVNS